MTFDVTGLTPLGGGSAAPAKRFDTTGLTPVDAGSAGSGFDTTGLKPLSASDVQPGGGRPSAGPTGKFKGLLEPGNIDLAKRPKVKMEDGSIATVRSSSFELDGKEVLLPTVSPDGKLLSNKEAIELYRKTGQHLGKFDNPDDADVYAEALHKAQEKFYVDTEQPKANAAKSDGGFFSELGRSFKETILSQNPRSMADAMEMGSVLTREDAQPTLVDRAMKLAGRITDPIGTAAADIGSITGIHASDVLKKGADTVRGWANAGSDGSKPAVSTLGEIHSPGDAVLYVAQAIGNAAGSSAPSLVAGAGVAAATKNPVAGFFAGAFGPSYIQNSGDTYATLRDNPGVQQAIKDGKITDKQVAGWAAAASVPIAALDAYGAEKMLPIQKLKGEIVSRVLKRILIGGATEGGTEGFQQVLQEATLAAAGGDHTLAEAAMNVIENAVQGAIGGTAIGVVTEPLAGEAQPDRAKDDTILPGVAPEEELDAGTAPIDERMQQPQAAPPASAGASPVSGATQPSPAAAAPVGGPAPVTSDEDLLRETLGDDVEELKKPGGEHLNAGDIASPLPTSGIREGKKIIDDLIGAPADEKPAVAAAKPDVTVADITGENIDGDLVKFHPDSGTLNVPREEMPQIKAEHRGAMVNFLAARGIDHQSETVAAGDLKPTQGEFSREKVEKAKSFEGGDRSILVSSDGYVLDGHHQWLAKMDAAEPVDIIRLDAPMARLLSVVKEFPSASTGGAQPAAQTAQPVAPQGAAVGAEPEAQRKLKERIAANRARAAETAKPKAEVTERGPMFSAADRSLTPAIFYDGKVYSAKGSHLDALAAMPENLRRKAETDSDNRGYVTARGKFVDRFEAQKYAVKNGLISETAPKWAHTSPELIAENLRQEPEERGPMFQARSIREGKEKPADLGLTKKRSTTYEIAAALQARQREKYGTIARDDHSVEASNKIADWIIEEVKFEMQPERTDKSGAGWYSHKFQRALDKFGKQFPELVDAKVFKGANLPGLQRLGNKKNARNFLTALIAITSDGQKVAQNFQYAAEAYESFRTTGVVDSNVTFGADRNASIRNNLDHINSLLGTHGPAGMHKLLMEEKTVSQLKKDAEALDIDFTVKYQAHIRLPLAGVVFGPKLGAFYANLMGAHGYLTMDRWWSRTFNRYRGQLLKLVSGTADRSTDSKGRPIGLARFKEMLGTPEMSDDEALAAALATAKPYADRDFKNGTDLEKAANTIRKDITGTEDSPFTSTDRTFMIETVERAARKLANQGIDISVADIQAVLWYFEKRLYSELGAKETADISYEEVAGRVAGSDGRGREPAGDQAGGSDAPRFSVRKDASTDGRGRGARGQAASGPDGAAQQVEPLADLYDVYPSSVGPNQKIFNAKQAYLRSVGMPVRRQAAYVKADPKRGKRIADAFDAMQHSPQDPTTVAAYRAMIDETVAQYRHLEKTLGLEIEFIKPGQADPYADSPRLALQDLHQNAHLWVFPTDAGFGSSDADVSGNPLLEETDIEVDGRKLLANDVFRIVHDVFGHGPEGAGFGASGEENAWQSHVRMFSPLAARAMTTETRGQNSWVNFGPHGEANRSNQKATVFADQKIGLLPDWVMQEGIEDAPGTEQPKAKLRTEDSDAAFRERAQEVGTRLRDEMNRLGLDDVGLRISETLTMMVDGKNLGADGTFVEGLIKVALDAANYDKTLHHEAIHALKALKVFTPTEWAILERMSNKKWRAEHEIGKHYREQSDAVQTEEGIAEAFVKWKHGSGSGQTDGIIKKIFRKIDSVLRAIERAFSKDARLADQLFRKIDSGEIGRRERNGSGQRQDPMFQAAWHGTPHDFDQFSLDAMGTGEGAQAYGWGLYFAGKKAIAEYYRDKLSANKGRHFINADGGRYAALTPDEGIVLSMAKNSNAHDTLSKMLKFQEGAQADPSSRTKSRGEIIVALKSLIDRGIELSSPGGKLFKVDLPEDSELMDYDAPLSEQSPEVREKLDGLGLESDDAPIVERMRAIEAETSAMAKDRLPDNRMREEKRWNELRREHDALDERFRATRSGQAAYRVLSKRLGGDRAASEALRAAGIPGHRFLDNTSRNSGYTVTYETSGGTKTDTFQTKKQADEVAAALTAAGVKGVKVNADQTHNYVIYDDSRISVEAKFRLRGLSGGIPPISSVTEPLGRRMMEYIKNNAKGDDETVKEYAQRKIVDYLAPVAQMIKEAGGTVADQMHVYRQARLAIDMATKGIMDMHGVYVTPMLDTLAKAGATMEDLDRYARAKHTPERNRVVGLRNEPGSQFHNAVTDHSVKGASGISTNEAKKILQDFQKGDQTKLAGIKEAHRMLREMLDQNLKTLLASGQISQAQYDDLTKQYVNYVPMMGEEMLNESGDFSVPGRGSGFDVRGKEFKGATGRFSEAENAPAWAISLAERGILRSKKNEVGKAALRFVNEFSPNGEIAEVYWKEDSPIQDPDMADIEKAQTVYKRELGKDGKVKKVKVPPSTISPDMFATKVGGRQIYIKFKDARIGGALKNLGVIELDAISRLSRKLTNFQSWANTRANPAFIPINAIRDAMTAFIHLLDEGFSTVEAAKVIGGIPKAFGAVWRGARGKAAKGQMDAMRQEWEQNGGRLIYAPHNSIEDTIKSLRKEMKAAASNPGSARRVGRYLLSLLGDLNDTIENSVRLSAYAAARAKGTSPQQSAFLARDLTVDFRKHGEIGPKMNSWFTFFNASVQGNINVAARLARSRKVQAAAASIMVSGVLMDILNRAIAGDDDDGENEYEKMLRNEPWKFERQMVIFYGPGKGAYFTIPMPYGYNAMYYTGLQMSAAGHGDISPLEAVGNSVRTTFDAFNPMGGAGSYLTMVAPTFLDPAIELATNEGFSGVPITPTRYPGDVKPDSQMSFRSTSDIWKSIAEGVNNWTGGDEAEPGAVDVSPDTLEYLWGFASGGIGRFLGQTYDTTSKLATGRAGEIEPEKVPFVRSFFGRQDDDNKKTEYYNLREEVSTVKKRIEAKKDISAEAAREYKDAHPVETHSVAAFDAAEKQLKVVRKQRRKLDADDDMPSADREAKNKELDKREIDIMNRARMAYAKNRKKEQ